MGQDVDRSKLPGATGGNGLANTVKTLCTGGSLLAALAGDSGAAAFVLAASDPLARGAEQLGAALNERIVRVIRRSATRVQAQVEAEGLSIDPELADDALRQAIGSLADAETDDKRRLIEEVLINTVRRAAESAARAGALRALEMIAAMPPAAVLVFASLAALQREAASDSPEIFEARILFRRTGLPLFMNNEAVDWLAANSKLVSVEVDYFDDGQGNPEPYIEGVGLSCLGTWLADWVSANATRERTDDSQGS